MNVEGAKDEERVPQRMFSKNSREVHRNIYRDIRRFRWTSLRPSYIWSDITNRSLIDILIDNPYDTIFLKSFEALEQVKDVEYNIVLLDGVIEEIEEHLVVQDVTDNASTYRAAGNKLEKRKHLISYVDYEEKLMLVGANRRLWKKVFKRRNWSTFLSTKVIFWFLMNRREGNVYRRRGTLDESLRQHKIVFTKAKKINKFITNHSWGLALMRKISKNELLQPSTIRLTTFYLALHSILKARKSL
ncbi:hypothetical protein M5K25_005844 [Dendrobium thyrsiflorum]|uniref:DUF659 domain-containing protein n=1 Tax=Dendrobium thyrsiflorum TaxID=117978 RepID=A0ABD0VA05_DENTH